MSNENSLNLNNIMETAIEAYRPYQEAISIMNNDSLLAKSLSESFAARIQAVDHAVALGTFNDELAKSLLGMISVYNDLSSIQIATKALGNSLSSLIKPVTFTAIKRMTSSYSVDNDNLMKIALALKPIADAQSIVDTSWLKNDNQWIVEKSKLAKLDSSSLMVMKGAFASLCILEQKTSLMPSVPDNLVSAASQIASITASYKTSIAIDSLAASIRLLEDYCSFAKKQHKLIQKATKAPEIEWRLGVLDATSKYVDRQLSWTLNFTDQIADEGIQVTGLDAEPEKSAISLIPTHIGYTRRESANKTPSEGLEESSIVAITEKGKMIADGIIRINKLQLDNGKERIFGLSETVVSHMMDFGSIVCTNDDQLGKIIDGLYYVFYENLEHIKVLIGEGDKTKGDTMVRTEEIYQCIFSIKTIRSDLRHDLDHGSTNERKKKLKNVGDCYRKYCGNRPMKAKEFRKIQEKLYDEIILLEKKLTALQLKTASAVEDF